MPRTIYSLAVCLMALVILTGFRIWLYGERTTDLTNLPARQRLRLFWIGLRLDGVVVSRCCLPVALAMLILPASVLAMERAWRAASTGLRPRCWPQGARNRLPTKADRGYKRPEPGFRPVIWEMSVYNC